MDIRESLVKAVIQELKDSLDTQEFLVYRGGAATQVPRDIVVSPDIPGSKVYLGIQVLKESQDIVEVQVTLDLRELPDIQESKEYLVTLDLRE